MKSVISANTASESKSFWQGWASIMKEKGQDFVQVDKPVAPIVASKEEAVDPNADYTKESELKALFNNH